VLLVGKTHFPPEGQFWSLVQTRVWSLEHLPAICAWPKTVTQTARSASPSPFMSNRAQASPVLPPDQVVSSSCHRSESVLEEEEHVGPGSHSWLRSFWPGRSSAPCPSLMQLARPGAAARRPSTSVTTSKRDILTNLSIARVIEVLSFLAAGNRVGRQAPAACRSKRYATRALRSAWKISSSQRAVG
jgi:hypothetical protein